MKNNFQNSKETISTGEINLLKGGNGQKLHFLHANGMCAGTYTPLLNMLSNDYEVTASDLRGHGDSSPVDLTTRFYWDSYSNDLTELLKIHYREPVLAIGHSMGGTISAFCAAQNHELFKGLVIIDPVIFSPFMTRVIQLIRLFKQQHRFPLVMQARRRKSHFITDKDVQSRFKVGRGMFKNWKEDYVKAYKLCALNYNKDESADLKCNPELEAQNFEYIPPQTWRLLKKIKCPVLILQGEHSDILNDKTAKKLSNLSKNITVLKIHDAGHFIPMEKPEETIDVIKSFFNQI